MKPTYTLFIFLFVILLSCNKDDMQLLDRTEEVLPGSWYIETVQLPGNGLGITYEGTTFYNDTTLYDVGTIEISSFKIENLDLQNPSAAPVPCLLTIKNEVFPYQINHIFMANDNEVFSYFDSSAQGVNVIDTDGEAFLYSSYIFSNNYYIVVVDNNHVRLEKGNDREGHVIVLKRW